MRLQAWELEKLEVSWEGTRPGWKTLRVELPASCKAGKGCWPCSLRELAGQVTGALWVSRFKGSEERQRREEREEHRDGERHEDLEEEGRRVPGFH